MEATNYILARDLTELHQALQLIPRDGGQCVDCDDTQQLTCPVCAKGESCSYTVPTNCQQCSKAICSKDASQAPSDKGDGGGDGPNVGAIAGGVIGGLIVIAIVSYLVWRFFVKPKRSEQSLYEEGQRGMGGEKDNGSPLTRRSSTHTVHSIASTVLTRASNIIQIAYIPGVTNRATPTSPDSASGFVPPVPPIPSQHVGDSGHSGHDDQHFFVPGNLRDSTYSGVSGYSDRTSYARTSYAPRSSIASTIYGKQAQVAAPAQSARMAKPTMVSVKSFGTGGSGSPDSAPPVPNIDFEKFGNGRPKSGASAFSVGSTFLNNANTATPARAQVIKVGGGLKKIEIGNKGDTLSPGTESASPSSPSTVGNAPTKGSAIPTVVEDSSAEDQGPFSDPPQSSQKSSKPAGLAVVAEDEGEEERIRNKDGKQPGSAERGCSPFGDEHAFKE